MDNNYNQRNNTGPDGEAALRIIRHINYYAYRIITNLEPKVKESNRI